MSESALQYRIIKQLNQIGKAIPLNGNTERGTPDILFICNGKPFMIECKVDGRKPTKIQEHRMKEWAAAGATVILAEEDFDVSDLRI